MVSFDDKCCIGITLFVRFIFAVVVAVLVFKGVRISASKFGFLTNINDVSICLSLVSSFEDIDCCPISN